MDTTTVKVIEDVEGIRLESNWGSTFVRYHGPLSPPWADKIIWVEKAADGNFANPSLDHIDAYGYGPLMRLNGYENLWCALRPSRSATATTTGAPQSAPASSFSIPAAKIGDEDVNGGHHLKEQFARLTLDLFVDAPTPIVFSPYTIQAGKAGTILGAKLVNDVKLGGLAVAVTFKTDSDGNAGVRVFKEGIEGSLDYTVLGMKGRSMSAPKGSKGSSFTIALAEGQEHGGGGEKIYNMAAAIFGEDDECVGQARL